MDWQLWQLSPAGKVSWGDVLECCHGPTNNGSLSGGMEPHVPPSSARTTLWPLEVNCVPHYSLVVAQVAAGTTGLAPCEVRVPVLAHWIPCEFDSLAKD